METKINVLVEVCMVLKVYGPMKGLIFFLPQNHQNYQDLSEYISNLDTGALIK